MQADHSFGEADSKKSHGFRGQARFAEFGGPCGLARWLRFGWTGLATALLLALLTGRVEAEDVGRFQWAPEPGAEATSAELEAWGLLQVGRPIEARERAERLIGANARSYVAHLVMGYVQHYTEANFPRSLFHLEKALASFVEQHGAAPSKSKPWLWHARILQEMAFVHGDLEHHAEKVRFIQRYNQLYDPDLLAERAWPLMKIGRYDEARMAAKDGIASGDPRQIEVALNALCAIEFEAGHDDSSYRACGQALEHARTEGDGPNAVDLTNFAEAARSLFRLDEAERLLFEATEATVAWYGNPWLELGELYTRQARFMEAFGALKRVPGYRARRPPHVRNSDRNESRRALAAFFLVTSRPEEALQITDKALVAPDRRAHNSRDPAQDRAIIALLDRRARLMRAQMILEEASSRPWYARVWPYLKALWLRGEAWRSGRTAAREIADPKRLVGIFRIGTAESAILPPWLAGDLVEVLGPGVAARAIKDARAGDARPGAEPYYQAFLAEAAFHQGDLTLTGKLGTSALSALGNRERLLAARVQALLAESARRGDHTERATVRYDAAFQADPGVFRRLGLPISVQLYHDESPLTSDIAEALARSPRLDVEDRGLPLRVTAVGPDVRACILDRKGTVLGCGSSADISSLSPDESVRALVKDFHARVFAPQVDMSQADIQSLDGSNRVSRNPFLELF